MAVASVQGSQCLMEGRNRFRVHAKYKVDETTEDDIFDPD